MSAPVIKDACDVQMANGREGVLAMRRNAVTVPITTLREPRIRFFSPSELRSYEPERDAVLVGNCHVMRGEVFVIGGEPGVGKSRAATALAACGATGRDWFGLAVKTRFRTMIIQTENGRYRLKQEFDALSIDGDIEESIRVSEPPPFGLTLRNDEFQTDIKAAIEEFRPDVVILDPWNAAAKDDRQADYSATFDALRAILPTGTDKPALGVVAHTRKPAQGEKRTGGTGLMHLLAGSYVLTSVPRSIFVMTRGSEDETDETVVWFNPKNSNGPKIARSAWRHSGAGYVSAHGFDWLEFDKAPAERKTVTLEHLEGVFNDASAGLDLNEAKHRLATAAGITEGAAYNALSPTGKFSKYITREGKLLQFTPELG